MTDARVWKYAVPIGDEVPIDVPEGATPLSAVMGRPSCDVPGEIWLYFLVDPEAKYVKTPVYVRGTDRLVPPIVQESWFVGTVLDVDANYSIPLVWHVWVGDQND